MRCEERRRILELPTVEERRASGDVITTYEFRVGHSGANTEQLFAVRKGLRDERTLQEAEL